MISIVFIIKELLAVILGMTYGKFCHCSVTIFNGYVWVVFSFFGELFEDWLILASFEY